MYLFHSRSAVGYIKTIIIVGIELAAFFIPFIALHIYIFFLEPVVAVCVGGVRS